MDMTIGIGRAVMEDEWLAALGACTQGLVHIHLRPARQPFRLFFGQTRTHRKRRARQEQRVFIIAGFRCTIIGGIWHRKISSLLVL